MNFLGVVLSVLFALRQFATTSEQYYHTPDLKNPIPKTSFNFGMHFSNTQGKMLRYLCIPNHPDNLVSQNTDLCYPRWQVVQA